MLNANYDYDRNTARNLVYPTGTEGWKTVGTLYNGLAGYLSWKDAKDRAARMDAAQNDYYEALKNYLNRKEKPVVESTDEETVEEIAEPAKAIPAYIPQTGGDAADYAYKMALARKLREEDQRKAYTQALLGG
jgi:hypothetical protein